MSQAASTEGTRKAKCGFGHGPHRHRAATVLPAICLALAVMGMLAGCQPEAQLSPSSEASPASAPPLSVDDRPQANQSSRQGASILPSETQPEAEPPTPEQLLEERVEATLASMTLQQKAAQLFVVRANELTADGSALTYVDDTARAFLANNPVGGIAFLADSLLDPDQTRQLTTDLQDICQQTSGIPLLLAVDEEGGTVARIGGNPSFPQQDAGDMRTIGEAGDTQRAYDAAYTMGAYVAELGITSDFAPVADVDDPPGGTMYYRSFGSDPKLVAAMVKAQVQGYSAAGVLCCVKHFPGIGSALGDSHDTPIATAKTLEEMSTSDLLPFKAAVEAKAPLVMVGHLSCPSITGSDMPATFCSEVVDAILRQQLGFDGVVVTDSLGMGAATQAYGDYEAAAMAIKAGCDLALMPSDYHTACQGVIDAVETGLLEERRLDESVARILRMKWGQADALESQADALESQHEAEGEES